MSPAQAGVLVAAAAAVLYGIWLEPRPPDWRRTLVKAAFAAALALAARFADAPPLLALALGLSALGDGALAVDPARTLAGGLVATLLARVAYVALFLEIGAPAVLPGSPLRLAGVILTLAAAVGVWLRLRPRLGPMGRAGLVGALISAAVPAVALTLPVDFVLAMLGAALLAASDAWGAARLADGATPPARSAGRTVWALYVAGQGAIAWSFLQPWRL